MSQPDPAIETFRDELKAARDKLMGAEHKALMRLWDAAADFAQASGRNEFFFFDLIIRQCANAFGKLDHEAAFFYFDALACRTYATTPHEWRVAEARRLAAFERLRAALQLAAEPAQGRG